MSGKRPSLARKIGGWSLLVLGVLGCVLPFLQGFLFLALGLFVLRDQYDWSARWWARIEERWPNMTGKVERLEARCAETLNRWGRGVRRIFARA